MEGFLLLAKSTRGAAAVNLVNQVLDAPEIYCFSELMEMPNIKEVNFEMQKSIDMLEFYRQNLAFYKHSN